MKTFLLQKRQKFHAEIRAQYLENYMKKIRYEVLKTQQTQAVNQLIDQTQNHISQTQLQRLIFWANDKDENNAIIHLGNLLIDGMVEGQWMLEKFQLRPKSSHYWPWLIKVIVFLNQQQSTQYQHNQNYKTWEYNCFLHTLNLLHSQLPAFCLLECLTIIKLLIETYLPSIGQQLFTTYKAALFSIKQQCINVDKNISCMCYEVIDMVVQAGDEHTRRLLQLYSLGEFQHMMVLGLGKVDLGQKKFPLIVCRTINNVLSTGIMLSQNLLKTCIKVSYNQKNTDRTKLELSYLWHSFVENCPSTELLEKYYDKILHIIEHMFSSGVKKDQCLSGIRENFSKAIEMLLSKSHEFSDLALMDVSYKSNILMKHYILNNEQGDTIKQQGSHNQPVDLAALRQYYKHKAVNNSNCQVGSHENKLNSSRNTAITQIQMELEN